MDQRNKVVIFGGIGLLTLAAVLVSLFYVLKSAKVSKITQPAEVPNSLSRLPGIAATPTAAGSAAPTLSDGKIFKGQGFSLNFPNNWGLLTCGNSNNFEFDPKGGEMKDVVCGRALKPVTFVIVEKLNCSGEPIKLGNNHATKTKTLSENGDVSYRWCTMVGNISFDITHRVSESGGRATSQNDFSKEVEKIIASISKD